MSITTTFEEQPEESISNTKNHSTRSDEHESFRHPLGVRPAGNALSSEENASISIGLFARLPDALILTLLEWLDAQSLAAMGSTCRGLFAYCSYDQLWRELATSETGQEFEWRGSWRASLRQLPDGLLPRINCRNVFSDALHRPYICSRLDVGWYANASEFVREIPRLSNLSTDGFNESWTDRPFILTEPVTKWQVYRTWSWKALAEQYADVSYRAEAVDWPLKMYVEYMGSSVDESPLYLFDRSFVEKMSLQVGPDGHYEVPPCFKDDLFSVLDDQRPDHRWLIVGPERSGSTFHKDPNATSAWNAVIRGSKYWIMFPPSVLPPGVFVSDDQSEVTSPLSIAEWLLTFHDEARHTPGCVEGICEEGEVLHVPSGWWHLVVNLKPAIAITQNFVPRSHLHSVAHFLDRKRSQISGFKTDVADPFQLFLGRLRKNHPELAASIDSNEINGSKKRKWEEVVAVEETEGAQTGGFSFGFGDLESESETDDS